MEKKYIVNLTPRLSFLLFLFILAAALAVLIFTFQSIIFAIRADEGYYYTYSYFLNDKGITSFPYLFQEYINNQQNWVYPNPLRAAFIILSYWWMKIFGFSFYNLAGFSLFCYVIFLFISFCYIKKYFSPKIAILSIILLAFSPLNMAMARRALMDSTSNLFAICAIWLFWDYLSSKKNLKALLFVLAYALTILTKESSTMLAVFFLLYLFLRRFIFGHALTLKDVLVAVVFPCIAAGLILILSAGGISPIVKTAKIILMSPYTNPYAIYFCSGPWYRYLIDFMLLSPWVCILAIAFSLHYLIKDRLDEKILYWIVFSFSLIFIFNFFTKNVRYLITLDFPLRLFSVLMLNELTTRLFKKRSSYLLLIAVILIAFFDLLNFNNLFIRHAIYDPVSQWLLRVQHIIN
jgi:4-amino-4-deoxy-L-arabinose transferase-like glycosyltransferase